MAQFNLSICNFGSPIDLRRHFHQVDKLEILQFIEIRFHVSMHMEQFETVDSCRFSPQHKK